MKKILLFLLAISSTFSIYGAKKEKFFAYRSFWPETAAMRQFAEAGIDLYAVMPSNSYNTLGEPYCKFPPFWLGNDTYLWSVVDEQFDIVLRHNPKAKFICMIDINSPIWLFRRVNRIYGCGGDSFQEVSNSLCTKEWLEPTEKMVREYVKHMEERYGDKIFAYMIAGGGTSEWYCSAKGIANYPKAKAWEKWLKERNLPDWDVPHMRKIHSPEFEKTYFNPETQQDVIQYGRFIEETVSNGADYFSKIVKEIVGDKKQIGYFCGFIPKLTCGKLDNRMTFSSTIADFVGDPGGYDNRDIGAGGGMIASVKSAQIRGKHWFQEIDHRTHTYNGDLTPYKKVGGIHASGAKNQKETDAMLKREFSLAAIMQNSLWCFDMWGGIFKTQETMEIVKKSYEIWNAHKDDNLPMRAEIALISDPDSGYYSRFLQINSIKKSLYSIGAPFDHIFFEDIDKVDFSKYKMVIFPHSFEITQKKKELLDKYVFKDNKTVITMLGFGLTDGKNIDTTRTEKLVGIPYKTEKITKRKMDGWTSIYAEKPWTFNKVALNEIARDAGVHIYTEKPLPVYANEKLVAVHVKDGGKKTISLPKKVKRVKELYTNKVVAENTDKFEYEFKTPDTALFELE